MAEIIGSPESFNSGTKRFYIPGVSIKDKCPNCGAYHVVDLRQDYVSYPIFNDTENFMMYCYNCKSEWEVSIVVKLSVEVAGIVAKE